MTDPIQQLLEEGDALLSPAFLWRDAEAHDRLRAITHELVVDYDYNGAELGRRWGRDRRTISVWKRQGAALRRPRGGRKIPILTTAGGGKSHVIPDFIRDMLSDS